LATTFVSPALFPTFGATICRFLLMGIELGLLIRRQDPANLRELLRMERLAALHYLLGLKHVAADRSGITLLASSASRIHIRLGLGAERLVLRLILRADRLDLSFLRIGQVEIATESKTFITATETSAIATAELTAIGASARCGSCLGGSDASKSNGQHSAKRQGTDFRH
jgi:hypothetical protein